jgi:hypothetical protein
MAQPFLLVAAWALFLVQGKVNQAQGGQSINLSQYIASMHWDAAKSGPLIAVEADRLYIDDDAPNNLAGFEQKMVKAGGLSVIAQNWAIALDDADLPNAYQALSDDDKLVFLLATLSNSDLAKLTGNGLSPRELSGEQRLALMSMIPKPLTFLQGTATGGGFESREAPITLPDDQVPQVKLQLRKGVEIGFGAFSTGPNGRSNFAVSSLEYRSSDPAPALRSAAMFGRHLNPSVLGRLVDSTERKSEISWSDARLSKTIPLQPASTIAEVVKAVKDQTGVEVYADIRIGSLTLNAYGTAATAGDLLRGIALAIGGAIRRVGAAYVLTSDLEGAASSETRFGMHLTLGRIQTLGRVAEWRASAEKRRVLANLGFPSDDAFDARSIPADKIEPGNSGQDQLWVQLSDLPPAIQSAVSQMEAARRRQAESAPRGANPGRFNPGQPVPELAGKAFVTSTVGYRFVLPDGRPLENHPFELRNSRIAEIADFNSNESAIPCDPKKLAPGSAVAIKSDDAETVTRLCGEIKAFQIPEIWLDSQSPSAINAALDSGLKVDLIVRPWRALKGERVSDPDRNILGLTGTQLDAVPEARFNPGSRRTDRFGNSFSPADPTLPNHFSRLAGLIPKKGIHRIVVLDIDPAGYREPPTLNMGFAGGASMNGAVTEPGLQGSVPGLFEFGYTTELRLAFLRQHQIDPIDIKPPMRAGLGPPIPYFDPPMMMPRIRSPYPGVHFPRVQQHPTNGLMQAWQAMRHQFLAPQVAGLVEKLTPLCDALYLEPPVPKDHGPMPFPTRSVKEGAWESATDWKGDKFVSFISFNPLNTEDEQGELAWRPYLPTIKPFCWDLSEVPANRFRAYLSYFFKPTEGGR